VEHPGDFLKRRVVDVRIEHGPAEIEFPSRIVALPYGGAPAWTVRSRGETRLVVDLPARSQWRVGILTAGAMLLIGVPVYWGLSHLLGEPWDASMWLLALGSFGLVCLVVVIGTGMFAKREVLEFDSRYVTVTRGDQLVASCPRIRCTQVRVWTPPPAGPVATALRKFIGVSPLSWGDGQQDWGSAGSGISPAGAADLVPIIQRFLDEHPAETDLGDAARGKASTEQAFRAERQELQ